MGMRVWPADDPGLVSSVLGHYRQGLVGSSEAQAWLARRRLADVKGLEQFGVGFSDRTLGLGLPVKVRGRDDDVRGRLQRLGLLRPSGHEHFRGCVTFPVVDAAGDIVQVYGRTLLDDARLGAGRHRWLPSVRRGVWNLAGLVDEVIVCDGIIDALSWWCAGFRSVTAVDGPGGFDDELATTIVERGVGRVVIAFAADTAGDAGAREVAKRLGKAGISCSRIELPRGLGVNEVVVRAKQPTDALGRLLRQAVWIDSTPAAPSRRPTPPAQEVVDAEFVASLFTPESGFVQPPLVDARLSPSAAAEPAVEPAVPSTGTVVDGELRLTFGDRRWRVRGLGRVSSFESLKVNVFAARGDRFHVDSLDLYTARARAGFIAAVAVELGVDEATIKADLGKVLLACEAEAERVIVDAQTPTPVIVELSEAERVAALELLGDPDLIGRIATDLAKVGIVGETSNGVVGYLAAVSRKLDSPLAVVVQSTSAAGKSALVDAVLGFVPSEELVRYSAMTGQSLFYMGGGDLAHKVLAVAEEEGASRAAYALKLLQSDGQLSIASTGKDGTSGRLVTHTYKVQGPTAIFLTTTAIDIDEELLNRCLVLSVDESAGQTRAIHARQRHKETLAGLVGSRERELVVKVHQDAQRLLERVAVVNPFAERLTFADTSTRTRRDHAKYLALIRAVTFLHQHQRVRRTVVVDDVEVTYVETTAADVAVANRVANEVLGRSLDVLPPQTRRLLDLLHEFVTVAAGEGDRSGVRFSRRQVRESVGWGDTQLKVHLARLVDLELVVPHKGDGGTHLYELAWDGQGVDGSRFVIGLCDPATLYESGERSGGGRPPVGGWSGGGRDAGEGSLSLVNDGEQSLLFQEAENHCSEDFAARGVVLAAAVGGL